MLPGWEVLIYTLCSPPPLLVPLPLRLTAPWISAAGTCLQHFIPSRRASSSLNMWIPLGWVGVLPAKGLGPLYPWGRSMNVGHWAGGLGGYFFHPALALKDHRGLQRLGVPGGLLGCLQPRRGSVVEDFLPHLQLPTGWEIGWGPPDICLSHDPHLVTPRRACPSDFPWARIPLLRREAGSAFGVAGD